MSKIVWCEQNVTGLPIRMLRDNHEAMRPSSTIFDDWDRAEAIASIRHQCFLRSKGFCELCGSVVTENSGHLHEQKHRGKGGEISLVNSVFICARTHQFEHRDRNPRFTKKGII